MGIEAQYLTSENTLFKTWRKRIDNVIIDDIICSTEILDKLERKHHVSESEIYEVLLWDTPIIRFTKKGSVQGENLYIAYGRTEAGRYLKIHFIYKKSRKALIVTARDMSAKERRRFYGSR